MAEDMKTQVTIALEDQFTAPLKELLSAVKLMAESVVKLSEQTNTVSAAMNNFQQPLNEVKTDIQAALKPLETMAKDNKELKATVQTAAKQLEEGNGAIKHMATAMEGSCRSADHLEREMTELKSVNQAQAQQINTLQNRLNELAEAHRRAAEEAKKQKEAESTLEKKLESVKDLAQNAGQVMQGVGAALAAPAAAVGMVGAGMARASMSTDWAATRLGNTFTNEQAKYRETNLKDAKKLALELAMKYPGSTEDVLATMASMAEMGVEFKDIMQGGANSAVQFASMFNMGFEDAGRAMVQFGNNLGVNVGDKKQGEQLVDELQRLRAVTGADAGSLQETMKYLGPTLATLGQQGVERTKETTTILAMLNKTSMGGSMAGTNYGELLSHTAALETTMGRKRFQKIYGETIARHGINLKFFDENGKFKGQREMIKELGKLNVLSEQEQLNITKQLFGETGGRVAAILAKQGVAGFDKTRQYMNDQLDAQTSLNNIMNTYQTKWETLQASLASVKVIIGDQILDSIKLKDIFGTITDKISQFGGWMQTVDGQKALKEILSPLAYIPKIIEVSVEKLEAVGKWVSKYPEQFAAIGKRILTVIGVAAPIGTIIASAGTGLVVVGTVLEKALSLGKTFLPVGGKIGKIFSPLKPIFKGSIMDGLRAIGGLLARIGRLIPSLFNVSRLFTVVKLFARASAAGMLLVVTLKFITNHWKQISDFFTGFGEGFLDKCRDIEAAAERVKIAFEPVLSMIDQALDWLLGKPPKDIADNSMVNGYALGDTFGKFLELILELIENAGYLTKAFLDMFAEIGKNLGETFNWIGKIYDKVLAIIQKWGMLQSWFNPVNNFGGDVAGRINTDNLGDDEIAKIARQKHQQAAQERHRLQEQVNAEFAAINKIKSMTERNRKMDELYKKYGNKEAIVLPARPGAPKGSAGAPASNTVNNITVNVTGNAAQKQVALNRATGLAKGIANLTDHYERIGFGTALS